MFSFNFEAQTLNLNSNYLLELVKGNLCPSFEYEYLEFFLSSDVLGEVTRSFQFKVIVQQDQEVTYFDFDYDWEFELNQELASEGLEEPSIRIS